jgi:prolyl-tRNA synthetase
MKLSRYFLPTLRQDPKEAEIVSHRLMLRAGLIQNVVSGVYSWLPLGLRVLEKIKTIVRQEQNAIGAQEMLAPTLQPASLWQESGRYEDYGQEMLRIQDRSGRDLLYGPTAEEVLTDIVRRHVQSYKQVEHSLNLYNIQWKFRDEVRPRFGVMRGREFLMKDGYSFDLTKEAAQKTYRDIFRSYIRTFQRLGLQAIPLRATTGPIGGDFSHEFHVVAATGESALYYDARLESRPDLCEMDDFANFYAMADEKHDPATCPLSQEDLRITRGIEVGHIFYFGTKYSQAMKAAVTLASGQTIPLEMGSYGIGVSRLVGALIEAFHDTQGIQWPMSVAPFAVGLLSLKPDVQGQADVLYHTLQKAGLDVLWDDRDVGPGDKFSNMDLIGLPFQVILGERLLKAGEVELKCRRTNEKTFHSLEAVVNILIQACQINIRLPEHRPCVLA